MPPGELITRWTVRLALACYFIATALQLTANRGSSRWRAARLIWTIGCIIFLLHVAAAFHYFHEWSHDLAYEETRRQSRETAGFDSGIGLWLNYLFTLVWLIETILWWRSGAAYARRPAWRHAVLHGFMLFMIINATVVFETGAVRWLGLAGCVLVVALAARRSLLTAK